MARNKWRKWTNNPLKSKMNVMGPVSRNENVLLDEFKLLHSELTRIQRAAKKRIARSHESGVVNLLDITVGVRESATKITAFKKMTKRKQVEEITKLRKVVINLQRAMDSPFSSLEGMRQYLEDTKKINTRNPTKGERTIMRTFYEKFKYITNNGTEDNNGNQNSYKAIQKEDKRNSVQELMDAIDADKNLTDDEKEDLKRFLRQKLNGDKPDYDSQIPGMDIEEILEKYPEYQKYMRQVEQTAIANFNMNSNNLANSSTHIF